jgi:hypothetical protein
VRRWPHAAVAALTLLLCAGCGLVPVPAGSGPPGAGVDFPSREEFASAPLGAPPAAPPGQGGYAFLQSRADGSPVTFDPCLAVHYVVRPDNAPDGGDALLASALAEVSTATGLRFVPDGATDEVPVDGRAAYQPQRYGDHWSPVLVAWSTPEESPWLRDGVLGRAGPAAFRSGDDARFVSGVAVFNGPALDLQLRTGQEAKARAVLLHELGHLVGLAHVTDPYQVMFDTNAYPLDRFRAGDLRGLAQLGAGRCHGDG